MKQDWIEATESPVLAMGEVHVWLAHVPEVWPRAEELASLLSSDERERVARFKFAAHRERAQVARGVLRLLLARYTGRDVRSIAFAYNPHGKPQLADCEIHFNISHSGDYVVFAFTRVGIVGVDIEQVRQDMKEQEAIAERHFAPGERQQLAVLPESERTRGFFELWTRKEAFIKARGEGLFSGLNTFETSLDYGCGVRVNGVAAHDWWMFPLPDVPGYVGAVVVNAAACVPRFFKWK